MLRQHIIVRRDSEIAPAECAYGIQPNQRSMRFWHAAKSTPNARMAFVGRELRFPTISQVRRDSEIALTENVPL